MRVPYGRCMASCPRCAEDNPDRARFCLACGAELVADVSQQVRKTVTLVFADLIGSTALGEQLEPESLRAVTDRYFEEMRRVVEHHGGTVEKFVGDAVLAVFGVPVAHEDDALRAVRAAADMQAALATANDDIAASWAVRISARIGVNSGQVVVGASRAGGSFATGDAVNVAARLEQAAEPGQVLLGDSTFRLVEDWVEADPLVPLTLKGKATPVEAYVLRSVRSRPRDGRHALATPLVGRDADLALLRAAVHRAIGGVRPHVLTVTGAAGVGKSRLVTELVASLDPSIAVLTGSCTSYGDSAATAALGDLVRSALGSDAEPVSATDARQRLLAILGATPEAELAADRLAAVADLGGSTGTPEELATALRRLLVAMTRQRPVAVVVEDLHFAQPDLLDLLESAVTRVDAAGLVVLATTRPELWETDRRWAVAARDAVTLTLQPLAAEDVRALAGNLLGGRIATTVVTALTTTEGNPLFVEHVVGALRDAGALRVVDDRWSVVDADAVQQVPATINAILGARVDQLPTDVRAVLERAAVIGRSFPAASVIPLLPEELRRTTGAALEQLRDKGLLQQLHDDPPSYTFAHALLREAAYDRLPKATRAELHVRLADCLDTSGQGAGRPDGAAGDQLVASLRLSADEVAAFHLVAALKLRQELRAPDTDTTLVARAVGHSRRAAARLGAVEPGTARRLLVEAWDACGPSQPGRLELLPVALAAFADGHQAGTFLRVIEEAQAQATGTRWADIVAALHGAARMFTGAVDPAQWDAAIATARAAAGDDEMLHAVVARVNGLRCTLGDLPYAALVTAHEEAAAAAERAGDTEMHAHALSDVATFLHYGDNPVSEMLERARDIDLALAGGPFLQSHSRAAMALALAELGRRTEALAAASDSRALYSLATGSDFDPVYEGFFLADVEILCGDQAAGCGILLRAADALEQAGELTFRGTFLGMWTERAAIHLRSDVETVVAEILAVVPTFDADFDLVMLRAAADLSRGRRCEPAAARVVEERWRRRHEQGTYIWLGSAPIAIRVLRSADLSSEAATALEAATEVADRLGYVVRASQLRSLATEAIPVPQAT
jgi:class 3 adenylate cyclase